MLPLTENVKKSYMKPKFCYICKEELNGEPNEDKNCHKLHHHCRYTGKYKGAAHSICNAIYKRPKQFLVVLHNGSNYRYFL